MLSRDQIKYLKKHSHSMKPVFQIGKAGESEKQIQAIVEYLEIYELVKISISKNAPNDKDYYAQIFEEHGVEIVNKIGRVITVCMRSDSEKKKSTLRW